MEKEIDLESPRLEDKEFTHYWNVFVADVSFRENLKRSHLEYLTILCQLRKEFDSLSEMIQEEGYTYSVDGRNGSQQKINPTVQIRDKVTSEIRQYGRHLGLLLDKDNQKKGGKKEVDEWV